MADEIPQWAAERVCQIVNKDGSTYTPECFLDEGTLLSYSIGKAFARYIMEHEEEPLDPLLIEARRLGAEYCPAANKRYETGELDDHASTKALVAALHRGIELGKAGEA